MLEELRVENLGIIAELQLVLGEGLTAITGETGAGKTLIVEALSLLLGGRADTNLVRSGADAARVEGRFRSGDDEVVLARVIPVSGRTRAYIDGRLATVAELSDVARGLVDLHGQHDQQSLLVPSEQRVLLDAFIGADASDARRDIRAARVAASAVADQLGALGGDDRTRAREIDLLQFQISEIDDAAITTPDEDDVLAMEIDVLSDAEEHRRALSEAFGFVDQAGGDLIGRAVSALQGRAPFAHHEQRVRALQAELDDLARELRIERDGLVADPNRLAELGRRRQQLRELRRKYGESLADVLAYRDECQRRLDDLEGHADRVSELEAERTRLLGEARAAAQRLHDARVAAAPRLSDAVTSRLGELALGRAQFSIDITPTELGDDGADVVTFVLAANSGEPARPLARAASGGELSRTMLAIRVVLSQAPPTLIFDEVDAGIGGDAGVAVGRALAQLAGQHQVLVVTHLAQVAVAADHHVHVAKAEVDRRTTTNATVLLDDARVHEIARMLGGSGDSSTAVAHAREMLAAVQVGGAVSAAPRRRRTKDAP